MVQRVNRTLIQIISSYIDSHHSNREQILQHLAITLRIVVHESAGKTLAKLVLSRKIITLFQ